MKHIMILLALSIAMVDLAKAQSESFDRVEFNNPLDHKDFITGQYKPMIYGSRSGGRIPGGSSSLILQTGFHRSETNRSIFFRTADVTRMVINYQGNIGIGTSSPGSYLLNVWGKVRAHEIVVNTNGADFVFGEGYLPMGLPELEGFIKENRHLPDIPTASEMQEEGVGVADLQTKLLQKIEELTLYVIDMNKEIQLLKEENRVLKKLLD